MTDDDKKILDRLERFLVDASSGRRAPNKALLLLLALGRIYQPPRLFSYHEWRRELLPLLNKYGLSTRQPSPQNPFCRLFKTDGLWDIPGYDEKFPGDGWPSDRKLRDADLSGGLPKKIHAAFSHKPELMKEAVTLLLNKNLPREVHDEVLKAVGLKGFMQFRTEVLRVYKNRCAICGYDTRVDNALLGLEAAHIRAEVHGGPNKVPNGLALCPVHHEGLKAGGISLTNDRRLLVSPHLSGSVPDFWFHPYADKPIAKPTGEQNLPALEHIRWHREHVWRG